MSSASAGKALRANAFTALTTLFPTPVLVTYGPEGTYQAEDIIELRDLMIDEGEGPMSPMRRRDFDFNLTGIINCYRGGGTEVQQLVTERALDMLGTWADYLQDAGTTPSTQVTLGNSVLWARLASWELVEEDEDITQGRTTVIGWTVRGRIRA